MRRELEGSGARRAATTVALALFALPLIPAAGGAQLTVAQGAPTLEARVWLDRGNEPVLRTGDQLRVYYRANADAYVAIFRIDTDGTTSLVFPHTPDENHFVRGGRDYRLLFPRSPYWYVDDQPGLGYFFIIASPEPFDFSRFQFSHYDVGWDLGLVGRQVYRDPYVAMDDYVATLLPDWEQVPYALDFASYNVGERYQYPRFLCYDCHGFRSYAAWNPYYATCTNFRVVIYDDPYFYPARRYRADRVVWARPVPDRPRFAFKQRFPGDPAEPLLEQVVGERTRGVVAPTPRRSTLNGAGGVAPSTQQTPARTPAVIRGRTAPSTGASGAGERVLPPSSRPTDRVRSGAPPVSAPTTGVTAPATTPPRVEESVPAERPGASAPAVDSRLRPVLRKRPSDAAGAPAPTTGTQPRQTPEDRPSTASPSSGTRARPRVEPAPTTREPATRQQPPPSPSTERAPAVRRPSGEGARSAPSGGSDQPTVRTTPDGRPAVRRPPGG